MVDNILLAALASAAITEVVKLGRKPVETSAFALRLVAVLSGAASGVALDQSLTGAVIGVGAGGLSTTIFWAVKSWIKNRSSQV